MDQSSNQASPAPAIVFFDGECGLCHRSVQFLIRLDRGNRLDYSPLQGQTAATHLGELAKDPMRWSLTFVDSQGIHQRSSGILRAIAATGGWRKVVLAGLVIPPFIRDSIYLVIAKNRYRWFGRIEGCLIPTAEVKTRFLP